MISMKLLVREMNFLGDYCIQYSTFYRIRYCYYYIVNTHGHVPLQTEKLHVYGDSMVYTQHVE